MSENSGNKYVKEVLQHQAVLFTGAGALTLGSMALVITSSVLVALLPPLFYGVGLFLTLMFLPSHPSFKRYVDNKLKTEARAAEFSHLYDEVRNKSSETYNSRSTSDAERAAFNLQWSNFDRVMDRLRTFRQLQKQGRISEVDLDRLEETALDYLRHLYARFIIRERLSSPQMRNIEHQISALDAQIQDAATAQMKHALTLTKRELEAVRDNSAGLRSRDALATAKLTIIAEKFEEIFQFSLTSPSAMSQQLSELENRLRVQQESTVGAVDEVQELLHRRARQAQAQQTKKP